MSEHSGFLGILPLEGTLETREVAHIDVEVAVRIRRHQGRASARYGKLIGQGTSRRSGTGRERVLKTGEVFEIDVLVTIVVKDVQTRPKRPRYVWTARGDASLHTRVIGKVNLAILIGVAERPADLVNALTQRRELA